MSSISISNSLTTTNQYSDLKIIEHVGSGANADVKKAFFNDRIVALKIFKFKERSERDFLREANELKKLKHQNIVELIAVGKYKGETNVSNCIIVEFADVGSLDHVLRDRDKYPYTINHGISWLYQASDAVNYLHTRIPNPMIHRDLKPLNLLLMKGGLLLKVCDFGNACDIRSTMTLNQGSPCWIAPELINGDQHYNEKCDVYSYVVIIWEVITRLTPYFHLIQPNSTQIMFGVMRGTLRPKKLARCPKILRLIIERGLDNEPNRRPSMEIIYNIMKKLNELINKKPIMPIVKDYLRVNSSASNNSNLSSSIDSIKNKAETDIKIENHQNTDLISNKLADDVDGNAFNHSANNRIESLPTFNPTSSKGFHRRSKSYGNDPYFKYLNQEPTKETIKKQLYDQIEVLLFDPLDPLVNNEESIKIFNEHKNLIKEESNIQRELNTLENQKTQLEQIIHNINQFNELQRQKNLLIQEISKLKPDNSRR